MKIVFPMKHSQAATQKVYGYLRKNYPANVLDWVKDENWELKQVPLSRIKMARRPGGRDLPKVDRIADAIKNGEKMDPVVLVETTDGHKIADGYHRTLAYKRAGKKSVMAYVATGSHGEGPWDRDMHDAKLNKSVSTDTTLERLSELEHEQWMRWSQGVADEVSPERKKRWEKLWIPYGELSEEEKDKDREWARKVMNIAFPMQKSMSTFTPTPNSAWSVLRNAGYDIKPVDGQVVIDGCRIRIHGNEVQFDGKGAAKWMRWMALRLSEMQTSEDWVDGHQSLGQPSQTVKPW